MDEKEPQGHRATVVLEWDYSLGPAWINTDNLRNLLFTPLETNPGFLRVIEFEPPPIPEPKPEIDLAEIDRKKAELKARVIELEKTMQCNCDLDRWEPERDTGHSWVCRIHKKAKGISDGP